MISYKFWRWTKKKILLEYLPQVNTCLYIFQVTLLINNAGVVSGQYLLDTPDHLIQRTFDVNVLAHFWVRAFLTYFNENSATHSTQFHTLTQVLTVRNFFFSII